MSTLREQLLALIEGSSLSVYEIAKQSGVERSALSRFISGKGGLTLDSLEKLASVLVFHIEPGAEGTRTIRANVTSKTITVRSIGYRGESKPLLSVPVTVRKGSSTGKKRKGR